MPANEVLERLGGDGKRETEGDRVVGYHTDHMLMFNSQTF